MAEKLNKYFTSFCRLIQDFVIKYGLLAIHFGCSANSLTHLKLNHNKLHKTTIYGFLF